MILTIDWTMNEDVRIQQMQNGSAWIYRILAKSGVNHVGNSGPLPISTVGPIRSSEITDVRTTETHFSNRTSEIHVV